METAIINETVKGCNLIDFIKTKIENQPDRFFNVVIKPAEKQLVKKTTKKNKLAKVAEEMANENFLGDKEVAKEFASASRDFRKNFTFRTPPDFDSFENAHG